MDRFLSELNKGHWIIFYDDSFSPSIIIVLDTSDRRSSVESCIPQGYTTPCGSINTSRMDPSIIISSIGRVGDIKILYDYLILHR